MQTLHTFLQEVHKRKGPMYNTTDAPSEDLVLDMSKLLECFCGESSLLKMTLEIFLETLPEHIRDLRDAVQKRDGETLWKVAHSLYGTIGMFTEKNVVTDTMRLEMIGKSGDLSEVEEAYADLDEKLTRVTPILTSILSGIEED